MKSETLFNGSLRRTVFAVATIMVVVAVFMPVAGARAQSSTNARGTAPAAAPEEISQPRPYYAPDALAGPDTAGGELAEGMSRFSNIFPEEWLPASLVPERKDESNMQGSGAGRQGAGTGGWTPVAQPYTPSSDPVINYYPNVSSTTDSSGRQHILYGVTRLTDISQAPDAPGFRTQYPSNLYYTIYSEGSFSTPVQLTSFSGLDDTHVMMFWMDADEYLHLVYSKWTWGRDASKGPGDYSAYQHEGESLYYRYRSPEGVWSSPRSIADFSGASWAITGGQFGVTANRLCGVWHEVLNKETAPSTYSGRLLFIEGVKDSWNTPYTIKAWDYSTAVGQQSPAGYPELAVSPFTGEITVAFALRTEGAAVDQDRIDIYGLTRDPGGSWSSIQTLTASAPNEVWIPGIVLYEPSGTTVEILAETGTIYDGDAMHAPASNIGFIKHTTAGWQAPQNATKLPAGKGLGAGGFMRDAFGDWRIVFSSESLQWVPALPGWLPLLGDDLQYTNETSGGFSTPETIVGYQAGRYIQAAEGELDGNGRVHVLFEMHYTAFDIGTGYGVYYTDNASGAGFSSPQKISTDSDRVVEDVLLSCRTNGDVIASWFEAKANYVTHEPLAGAIYSRCMSGGAWSETKNVTAIPGSDEIMHVVYGVSAYGNYFYGYWSDEFTSVGEQRLIFQTARYNPITTTYFDFKRYYTESMAGTWGNPQQVLQADIGGYPGIYVDANERVTAVLDATTSAGKSVSYYSMQKSPTPPAYTYFFAEGTTRPGFQEWISIQNPGELGANVTITYMLGTGENKEQMLAIPAHSRVTVDVNTFVGAGQDVSARVSSDQLIVAERPLYFDYRGWTGGDDAVGSMDTGRVWYFAEGTTRAGFQEWLTLQNPSNYNTTADITYMLGDGSTKRQQVPVAARTRATVDVNSFVGPEQDVSMKVESRDAGIVAERPMYFDYHGYSAGGHNVVGSESPGSRWYFAEGTTRSGFDTYLCLQNPNTVGGSATITYILGDGSTKNQTISLPATSRQTVKVNDVIGADKDVSIVVDASTMIIAERPMYFNYHGFAPGGHNAMGTWGPKNSWFFAEGTTRTGFEEWLSLQNPGIANANVSLRYMLGDGSIVLQNVVVPAHTRVTVDVNAAVGPDKDVSVSVWSDQGIVAERPMYFDYHGIWPGGSDVMGL